MKKLAIVVLVLSVLLPARAGAQETLAADVPLSRVLFELYTEEIVFNGLLARELLGRPLTTAELASLSSDLPEALAITGAIGNQLSTFPLGSSAGGFSWTFNPGLGSLVRNTTSFGPVFAERALTVGKGQVNVGVNYQHSSFDEFDGLSLTGNEIGFFTRVNFGGATAILDNSFSMDLTVDTVGFYANYGATDRLDVGFAIPLVSVDMLTTFRFVVRDLSGREIAIEGLPRTRTGGRRKTGFGDMVLRSKFNVLPLKGGGVAAGLDVRLPTGDEENLIGIPGTQAKIFAIFSAAFGRFSPHVNGGYTFSRGNSATSDPNSPLLAPPDEVNFTAGVDVAVTPRFTAAADFVTRTLKDVPELTFGEVVAPGFEEFSFDGTFANLNQRLVSIAGRYNVWRNLLVSASVLIPASERGLRDKLTTVFGFDFSY